MDLMIKYAISWIGTRYKWGGENHEGWDCSGLVQEILASVGADPKYDQTAQALYDHFKCFGTRDIKEPGSLAFFGFNDERITHVGFMVDPFRMVEAGGGGSRTHTPEDAIRQNAFVRIRPIKSRTNLVCTILPHYIF